MSGVLGSQSLGRQMGKQALMMLCEDGLEAVLGTHRRHISSLVWGGGGWKEAVKKGFPEEGASI